MLLVVATTAMTTFPCTCRAAWSARRSTRRTRRSLATVVSIGGHDGHKSRRTPLTAPCTVLFSTGAAPLSPCVCVCEWQGVKQTRRGEMVARLNKASARREAPVLALWMLRGDAECAVEMLLLSLVERLVVPAGAGCQVSVSNECAPRLPVSLAHRYHHSTVRNARARRDST